MTLPIEPTPGTDPLMVDLGDPEPNAEEATVRSGARGRRVQRTINFEESVLQRARAAAAHLARNHPDAGVRSLADIVNPAVAARVAELESRYNAGNPFRPVFRMAPGRPAKAR